MNYDNRKDRSSDFIPIYVTATSGRFAYAADMARHWIDQRLTHLDKTKSGLARAMGIAPARVTEITKGQRRIKIAEVPALAQYLEVSEDDVYRATVGATEVVQANDNIVHVPVVGGVQAGVWREPSDMTGADGSADYVSMSLPREHRRYFAVHVFGNSMDRFYEEGAMLICVPLMDYNHDLQNGDHVIVQRLNDCGGVETTCKELQIDDMGNHWLLPRSSNPDFQTPWPLPTPDMDATQAGPGDLYVSAVVVGHFQLRRR